MNFLAFLYIALGVLVSVLSYFGYRFWKVMSEKADRQSKRLKMQMTSNIAHELRTPVTSIRGYLETLLACPEMPQEKKHAFLQRAYNQTLRLSDLISDMALITKIEESPEKLGKEDVDIFDVATEVFDEFSERIAQKNVTVENLLKPETVVKGNRTLVYAILRNLVENSLKYAGDGVTLHLECYSQIDKLYYFNYYDTGHGVPEEHLERIFERFYRVSEGRTRDDGGSGLGLSIVRNSVVFHGGDIKVMNRQGGGLHFFFTLRRKQN